MTERQKRWREIGDAFATPCGPRGSVQEDMTRFGLCWAIECVGLVKHHSLVCGEEVIEDFLHDIPEYSDGKYALPVRRPMDFESSWGDGWTPYCDEVRALFAYLMAELSDEEYKELIGETNE
jgi:hypothetical protein